jgi:uncharacterized protein YoxC
MDIMETLSQADIFFIISSIGFVLLWIFMAVFLFYLIRITKSFYRIMDMIEDNVNKIGDTTKELLEDLRDNKLFSFFIKKRRKSHEKK